tara:strand:+ start:2782 stop:3264 length:483 start_codon:yes stop_codon:yes gene_type:complete
MTSRLMTGDGRLEPKFVEKSYREALNLTISVAGYLAQSYSAAAERPFTAEQQIVYARESTRMTCCLMQVVSWLMIQKGVIAGEITPEEASTPKYRLGNRDVCLLQAGRDLRLMPDEFCDYLKKAQRLYRQVERLEHMLYEQQNEGQNPVHEMFDRLHRPD